MLKIHKWKRYSIKQLQENGKVRAKWNTVNYYFQQEEKWEKKTYDLIRKWAVYLLYFQGIFKGWPVLAQQSVQTA